MLLVCVLIILSFSYIKTGKFERSGSSITEGIGQGRITNNLKDSPIDDAICVPDADTSESSFFHAFVVSIFLHVVLMEPTNKQILEQLRCCLGSWMKRYKIPHPRPQRERKKVYTY